MKILVISKGISNTSKIVKQMIDNNLQIIVEREVINMKSCLMEIIDEMVQNYDICFKDKMTLIEYKKMIIKDIDKKFEKMYNQYKESEE